MRTQNRSTSLMGDQDSSAADGWDEVGLEREAAGASDGGGDVIYVAPTNQKRRAEIALLAMLEVALAEALKAVPGPYGKYRSGLYTTHLVDKAAPAPAETASSTSASTKSPLQDSSPTALSSATSIDTDRGEGHNPHRSISSMTGVRDRAPVVPERKLSVTTVATTSSGMSENPTLSSDGDDEGDLAPAATLYSNSTPDAGTSGPVGTTAAAAMFHRRQSMTSDASGPPQAAGPLSRPASFTSRSIEEGTRHERRLSDVSVAQSVAASVSGRRDSVLSTATHDGSPLGSPYGSGGGLAEDVAEELAAQMMTEAPPQPPMSASLVGKILDMVVEANYAKGAILVPYVRGISVRMVRLLSSTAFETVYSAYANAIRRVAAPESGAAEAGAAKDDRSAAG